MAPGDGSTASRMRTTAISGGHRPAQPVRDRAGGPPDVERLARAVQHDRDHGRVAAQHPQRLRRDRTAEVQARGPGPVLQILEPDQHVDVRAVPAALGDVAVVEDVAADLGQRLGLPLGRRLGRRRRSAASRARRSRWRSRRTSRRRRTGPSASRHRRAAGTGAARSSGPEAGRRARRRPGPAARPAPCPSCCSSVRGVQLGLRRRAAPPHPPTAAATAARRPSSPSTRAITSTCRKPTRPAANTSAVAGSRAGSTAPSSPVRGVTCSAATTRRRDSKRSQPSRSLSAAAGDV